jgi:hypothetical protein
VTSDELANVAISVTALAVEPGLRTVLRAATNEVTRETRALFPVGIAQDVERIAATALAASALERDVIGAFVYEGHSCVQHPDGSLAQFPA